MLTFQKHFEIARKKRPHPFCPSPKSAHDFKKGMVTTQMSEKVYVPDEDSLEQ